MEVDMSSESRHSQALAPGIVAPTRGPLQRHTHTYDLMRQCIHCGFCLPTCPTYAVLGVEMDSPRGRIYQMQAVAEGRLEISEDFIEHMYCCVGCRACETACPSGVQFGKLIEAAREQIQLSAPTEQLATDKQRAVTTASLTETHPTINTIASDLLRRFFFDLMLPSRLVTSLVFAGLKLYQRSGLQALAHRTGVLDLINNLPTPFQAKLLVPEALMDAATGVLMPERCTEMRPAIVPGRYRADLVIG